MTDRNPRQYYSEDQIANFVLELIAGRRKWVEEIAKEGLKPEILAAAERSFAIEKSLKGKSSVSVPGAPGEKEIVYVSEEPLTRPKRPGLWRWR